MKSWFTRLRPSGLGWLWTCVAFLAAVAMMTSWLALVAAPRERGRSLERWRDQLSAIADDRRSAVDIYITERMQDARLVASFPSLIGLLSGSGELGGARTSAAGLRAHLAQVLQLVATQERYRSADVLAPDGRVLARAGQVMTLEGAMAELPRRSLASRREVADFCLDTGGKALLQVAVPVVADPRSGPLGVVVFTVEPESWLYPFLRSQAVLSETAETILVRRDGDSALYLSPLRRRSDPPMTLRRSLKETAFADVLDERVAFGEYAGYRGGTVLATARSIPGTDWSLIVKVDREEALAAYQRWLRGAVLELGAILVALVGIAYGIWHRQRSLLRDLAAESEQRLGELVQHASDAVFVVSMEGRVLQANRRAEEIYGYSRHELRRLSVADLRAPETRGGAREGIERAVERGGVMFETLHCRRDGTTFHVEVSAQPAEIRGERFLLATVRDITERKRAEQALRDNEERLELALDSAGLGLWDWRLDTNKLTLSERWANILGYSLLELESESDPWRSRVHPDDLPAAMDALDRHLKGASPVYESEHRLRAKSGEWIWVADRGRVVERDVNGTPKRIIGTQRDVTRRRNADEALRESEERYRTQFEQSPIGIYRTTPDGRILFANPALVKMCGYDTMEELCRRNLEDAGFQPDYPRARFKEAVERTGELRGFEAVWATKDGRKLKVLENAHAIRGTDGRVLYYEGTIEDITAHKAAEDAWRHLATAVEQAAEAVIITDRAGAIEYVNPAFEWITGYRADEVIGANPRMLKSGKQEPGFYAEMWATISRGSVWVGRLTNRRKDGSLYEEEMSISPIRDERGEVVSFVAVKRDVTREVALQAQLIQAQKMEAVGKLAGGIAHDFNNLLQAIMSHVGVLRHPGPAARGSSKSLDELDGLVRRGASLTRQLLLFSHREVTQPERLDLNEAIRDATNLLRRLVREDVLFGLELDPAPLPVEVDRGQLDQVLMNLVVNASDAMPNGGRLVIRSGRDSDTSVWFEVEDTGHGIPEEIREHIFEPFFTTKGANQGTGLGLSVVHGIVKQHGGTIGLTTAPGAGTRFRITLPRQYSGEFPPASDADSALEELPPGRGERVLVVEDEPSAREGIQQILASLGYEVVAAGSGEEATALPAAARFDLLLTALMLPGITGPELAADLTKRWASLAVILMSGYAEDEALRRSAAGDAMHFLQKPFDIRTLAAAVRAVLDKRG